MKRPNKPKASVKPASKAALKAKGKSFLAGMAQRNKAKLGSRMGGP
jgi:hypothetical protein